MRELFRRIHYLLHRTRLDRELASEMEFHREMANLHGGTPFGQPLRLREEARDAWGWTWIERLLQDLRYATRQLRHSPGFTLAAILMLAIGIGVNVSAFGFFNLLVLRPLPVRDPATLLRFKRRAPHSYASQMPYAEMAFFRKYSRTLSSVIAVSDAKVVIDGEEKPLTASFVTTNFFTELGAIPAAGRTLQPDRDGPAEAEPVVVLSAGFWQRHFAGSRSLIGQSIRLNNKPVTVIGVASSKFSGLSMDDPDVWLPITQHPYFVNGSRLLSDFSVDSQGVTMFGRLKPDVTAAAVETELHLLAAELRKQHPEDIWENESLPSSAGGYAKNLGGGRHGTGKESADELYPVLALVGSLALLILVVACGNLGSLLLARGVTREREIGIRAAVGAGRGRIVRQLFTESLLLSLLGAAAGVGFGYLLLRILVSMTGTPAWLNPMPDWRVIAFAVAVGLAASLLFGLAPAVQLARQRRRKTSMRQVLIGGQVAASCILVIVAALLVRALNHALSAYPGFEYQEIVSIDPGLAAHGYTPARAKTYLDTLQNRLRGIPGIQSVSMSSSPPLGRRKVVTGADISGHSADVHMYAVDPQFFRTMKIPLLRGSNLNPGNTGGIVISKSFALQWPGDPLGKPFQVGDASYNVMGICGSARLVALEDSDAVEAYYLATDPDFPLMVVLVKASGPPQGLVSHLTSVAKSIDPNIFPEVQLLKNSFRRKMEASEQAAFTVAVLGGVALLLACLGIVGLVSYAVSQRTREIGLRMALGARSSHVLSVVMSQLALPISIGLVLGLAGAAGLSQLLRRQLFGVSNLDPLAHVSAVGIFALTVFVSAILPARRALRVDPARSLRYE